VHPLRWLIVRAWQWWCWFDGDHRWGQREVDFMRSLPGFRNPWLEVCSRCGATRVREEDE